MFIKAKSFTLLPEHLSKNSRRSFRAASLKIFRFTLPQNKCDAMFVKSQSHDFHGPMMSRDFSFKK